MTGSGPQKVKTPPLEAPLPTPEAPSGAGAPTSMTLEQAKAESVRKKLKARKGRAGTILTKPGTLGEPSLQYQTLLGRV